MPWVTWTVGILRWLSSILSANYFVIIYAADNYIIYNLHYYCSNWNLNICSLALIGLWEYIGSKNYTKWHPCMIFMKFKSQQCHFEIWLCDFIRISIKFVVNPHYEPWLWYMIILQYAYLLAWTNKYWSWFNRNLPPLSRNTV